MPPNQIDSQDGLKCRNISVMVAVFKELVVTRSGTEARIIHKRQFSRGLML